MGLGEGTPEAERGIARPGLLAWAGVVVLAVVLWGGYGHHWPWTGINGATATLWEWLHLLLLPLAAATLPVWFRHDTRVHPRSKLFVTTGLMLFSVVVILGYAVPWRWTGFRGNTVWDWFNLVFLPLTLVLIPVFVDLRRNWQPRHTLAASVVLTVFLAFVLGGYLGDWRWTGFTGNTLWKWMQLLFLPLLVPTVILPAFQPMAMRQVVYLDEHGNPTAPPSPADGKPAEAAGEARAAETVSGTPAAEATPERPVRL